MTSYGGFCQVFGCGAPSTGAVSIERHGDRMPVALVCDDHERRVNVEAGWVLRLELNHPPVLFPPGETPP